MNFLRCSRISYNNNFQLLGISNNNLEINNDFDSLNDLSESLNRNLNQSVLDFMNCPICLSPAEDPLLCQKCNNFACKKCLRNYFGNSNEKNCPICKQKIKFSEMKENKLIKQIENILKKDESKEKKVEKLSNLIKEKQNEWYNQNSYLNNLLEKFFNYQKFLNDYKKQYNLFFLTCQKVVEKVFDSYNKKVEDLINSLLSFNEIANNSIKKYDDIKKNYENNFYNNNNIKDLIKEILSMDRKHFNEQNQGKTDEFLSKSNKIIPSISDYKIREIKLKKEDFSKYAMNKIDGNHYKLGNYNITYNYKIKDGYKAYCKLSFTSKNNSNCFMFTQRKVDKNNKQQLIPMKLTKREDKILEYECVINFEEFDEKKENEVNMIIESLIFSM